MKVFPLFAEQILTSWELLKWKRLDGESLTDSPNKDFDKCTRKVEKKAAIKLSMEI